MPQPRFSVVIPTRERADTLRFTLQTCLRQSFDDYEVVVCDNCSPPATREVVEACGSPRVRYVRAPEPLAMSANWELAVSQARGEYVTVLGDDDGLMPFALAELDQLLRETGCPALRWDKAVYTWPSVAAAGQADCLFLPLARHRETLDGRAKIAELIRFTGDWLSLPIIYNAVIHRELIEQARAKAGRVFASAIPDTYSGFAFAYLAGRYESVRVPMSVSGLSGRSNGVATMVGDGRNAVAEEFNRLNARFGYHPHPWVPDLPIYPAMMADSFQHARDALFPEDTGLSLDRRLLAQSCVAWLWATDPEERRRAIGLIRASLADRPDLQAWFDGTEPERVLPAPRPQVALDCGPAFDGDCLRLNAMEFGVTDVAGAVALCARLLRYEPGRIPYDLPPRHAQVAGLQQALDRARSWLPYRLARGARRLLRRRAS
ncbi:MAG TPA: glycosyltransferase family 2 protein [Gemmataceae bacterium]|nr:glycosyltransferase family 2 protein [Gemmataceae bacterium]